MNVLMVLILVQGIPEAEKNGADLQGRD